MKKIRPDDTVLCCSRLAESSILSVDHELCWAAVSRSSADSLSASVVDRKGMCTHSRHPGSRGSCCNLLGWLAG